jgi:hypothetical protein
MHDTTKHELNFNFLIFKIKENMTRFGPNQIRNENRETTRYTPEENIYQLNGLDQINMLKLTGAQEGNENQRDAEYWDAG